MDISEIARVAYEAVRGYRQGMGDYGKPAWEHAGTEIQASTTQAVSALISNPNSSPEAQHGAWMLTRQKAGWKWGPSTDRSKKTHKDMLPYEVLPAATKAKDYIFQAVVRALHDLATRIAAETEVEPSKAPEAPSAAETEVEPENEVDAPSAAEGSGKA
jgi:hypothetical protein